ncbi:MAG: radical SAM protein [Desulfuromonadaceae bacterium]|nr:radical SAM protein [Desulfuromonadaceae bacterium]MDD2854170.1 radical SAM protein [Desulfuromonadaceae bacterium]
MLLIFPPLAKACEPPAGIVRLASFLNDHGISCRMLDANLEGQLWLLEHPSTCTDTWSRRAFKGRAGNLTALRDIETYSSPDRYRRAVSDLNRILAVSAADNGIIIGLADYQDHTKSPQRSADLLASALEPERNPFFRYFSETLPDLLSTINTVGFSLNYLSQALTTFAMIGFVRKNFPEIKIILGGGLVTSWMQQPGWNKPFGALVDHLISGAGELPLLSILKEGDAAKSNKPPDYSALPLDSYFSPGFILPYSAAEGCYWSRCSFCPERAEGNAYKAVPVNRALADLKILIEKSSPLLLHFLDNAINPGLLTAIAENPPGVPWYGFARISEQLSNLDFCHALKHSGCVMLKLGLESGDQGVLDRMKKGITVEVASQVLKNLHTAGIAVYCYILFGTPGETRLEAERTLEFVAGHGEAISFLNTALFNMPINGDEAIEYGDKLFYEGDLSLYTSFCHPGGWERSHVRRFIESEFKRHPAVAEIIRKDPPQFGSNHAAFFGRV